MLGVLKAIHGRTTFNRRARILADRFVSIIPSGQTILDVGCGDGTIDSLIQTERTDLVISGIDILKRPNSKISVTMFDGENIPFENNSFDFAMFIDVLHHTEDPLKLLREALRVARKGIIIKDHIVKGFLAWPTLRAMDWVGNAPYGVVLPYNYLSEDEWQSAFKTLGLKVEFFRTDLELYLQPFSFFFDRQLHFISVLFKTD
jgi:SAM-dependent methyltransferase